MSASGCSAWRRWWDNVGRLAYSEADRLLITSDGGGSNGYRLRLWKRELAELANQSGLTITVCRFPPGTTTRTGLSVRAELDDTSYPKGIKITEREMRDLETQHLTRHDFHGEWNYTVNPTTQP